MPSGTPASELSSEEAGAPPAREEGVEFLGRIREAIGQEIVGYEAAVRALTIAVVAEGHILLEGVPGLAKTHLVRAFAQTLRLSFRRIQFTPDMLPSDILGTTVLDPRDQRFVFRPGPVFANVILADEINRAPPKVQSALLEAMQEHQVTIDGLSHPLPRPFLVIATQNPIEHEGTYPLPEAELDRFLFRWIMGYPSPEEEVRILKMRAGDAGGAEITPILSADDVERLQQRRREVFVSEELYRYLAAVVRQTREDKRLLIGASPRASVQFLMAIKASSLLDGRAYVVPDDIRELAFSVFNHRVLVRPEVLSQSLGIGKVGGAIGLIGQILAQDLDAVDIPR